MAKIGDKFPILFELVKPVEGHPDKFWAAPNGRPELAIQICFSTVDKQQEALLKAVASVVEIATTPS